MCFNRMEASRAGPVVFRLPFYAWFKFEVEWLVGMGS